MIKKGDTVYLTEDAIKNILRQHSDKLCRDDLIKGRVTEIYGDMYKILLNNNKHFYNGFIHNFINMQELRIQKIKSLDL